MLDFHPYWPKWKGRTNISHLSTNMRTFQFPLYTVEIFNLSSPCTSLKCEKTWARVPIWSETFRYSLPLSLLSLYLFPSPLFPFFSLSTLSHYPQPWNSTFCVWGENNLMIFLLSLFFMLIWRGNLVPFSRNDWMRSVYPRDIYYIYHPYAVFTPGIFSTHLLHNYKCYPLV